MDMHEFVRHHGITSSAKRASSNPSMGDDEWSRSADHWKVTLKRGKKRYTTPFSMGFGHGGRSPETAEVLDSLISDGESFDSWCSNYGFVADRKAEKTYKACKATVKKLHAFLGNLYDEAQQAERL